MFCGHMYVKIFDNTQFTIQPYVCFNFIVHRPSFQKNMFYHQNIHVNWWKLAKNDKKWGIFAVFFFGGETNFLFTYT